MHDIHLPTDLNLTKAATLLRNGGLVAMPTETVYGLAADAANEAAVARLYAAKGRPSFNPLIAHMEGFAEAERVIHFNTRARALADAFWPGPLTLVGRLKSSDMVCEVARAGLSTLAVRVPAHAVARNLLAAFKGALVAPSANPSGQISPTEAVHVAADMENKVDMILDGGRCDLGIESTILDVTGEDLVLLRPGSLLVEDIEAVIGRIVRVEPKNGDRPKSPGQLLRHYAPRARLRLNAEASQAGEAYLGFGPDCPGADLNLSPSGDTREAATNLFWMLRALDKRYDAIAVAPIPVSQFGEGVMDRLVRAAKPA